MKKEIKREFYTPEQLEAVDDHIGKYFGKMERVLHEFLSLDIHCDVGIIPPTDGRNYLTLVTTGMDGHRMAVPAQWSDEGLERAELVICLPPDWNVEGKSRDDSWPVDLIKYLARFPIHEETWLEYGHSIPTGRLAANTDLAGVILLGIQDAPEGVAECMLPGGERVLFYQVIPLYENELAYKAEYGVNALLKRMKHVDHVVDISWPSAV